MKFTKQAARNLEAVAEVQKIVAQHGSIFRVVPQETDIGIDAFIECIRGEESTADLIALQIKGGPSFERDGQQAFVIYVDQRHLDYWNNILMPVLLVCYSPTKGLCWTSVHEEIEASRYYGKKLDKIAVPYRNTLNVESLEKIAASLTLRYRHHFSLLKFIDQAFDEDPNRRLESISMICAHPSAHFSPTAAAIARRLLHDSSGEVVRKAVWFLGYCTGRMRWSWNPGNADEGLISEEAAKLCEDIDAELFRRLFEACWEHGLSGPEGLPERLSDIAASCINAAVESMMGIASDAAESRERRQVALFIRFGCSDDEIMEEIEQGNALARELLEEWCGQITTG